MSASPSQVPLSGGPLIGNIGCALCPTLGLSSPSYHGLWAHKEAEAPLTETFLPSSPRPSGPCPVPFPGEMENWVGEGSASSCLLLVLLQAGIKAHCPTITSIPSSSIYRVTESHFSAPRIKSTPYMVQRPSIVPSGLSQSLLPVLHLSEQLPSSTPTSPSLQGHHFNFPLTMITVCHYLVYYLSPILEEKLYTHGVQTHFHCVCAAPGTKHRLHKEVKSDHWAC